MLLLVCGLAVDLSNRPQGFLVMSIKSLSTRVGTSGGRWRDDIGRGVVWGRWVWQSLGLYVCSTGVSHQITPPPLYSYQGRETGRQGTSGVTVPPPRSTVA